MQTWCPFLIYILIIPGLHTFSGFRHIFPLCSVTLTVTLLTLFSPFAALGYRFANGSSQIFLQFERHLTFPDGCRAATGHRVWRPRQLAEAEHFWEYMTMQSYYFHKLGAQSSFQLDGMISVCGEGDSKVSFIPSSRTPHQSRNRAQMLSGKYLFICLCQLCAIRKHKIFFSPDLCWTHFHQIFWRPWLNTEYNGWWPGHFGRHGLQHDELSRGPTGKVSLISL